MAQKWTHTAIIQSAVLFIDEGTEINFTAAAASSEPLISFSKPKRVDNPTWKTWDNYYPIPAWEYQITFHDLESDDLEEIRFIAIREIESLAARLSFFTSAPIKIVSLGHVTDAPKEPVMGVEYKLIHMASEQAVELTYRSISPAQMDHLGRLLAPPTIEQSNHRRIDRSLRWLQRSRLADSPTDEFACLIIAFENLNELLSPPTKLFWKCPKCNKEVESCPHCEASTERQRSGEQALANFVNNTLKWPKGEWKKIWKLRNKILHGSGDLTLEDQRHILDYLVTLEKAVVNAIRHVLHVSNQSPPLSIRPRVPIYDPRLVITWHHSGDANANQAEE